MSELKGIISALNKKFGVGTIGTCKELDRIKLDRIPTGIFPLDMAVGGGFPKGRIVEIYGEYGGAKSYVAMNLIAQAQMKGEKCCIIDAENAVDIEWSESLGVNTNDLIIAQPDTGEQALDILDAMVRSNEVGVVVLDSVAAISASVELDESMEKQQMGVNARMMNKGMRKMQSALNVKKEGKPNQTVVILINQLRQKIGIMFGNPATTPAGKGVSFGASIRVKLRQKGWIIPTDGVYKKHKIGQITAFEIVKNKTFTPRLKGEFSFYTKDVDREEENYKIYGKGEVFEENDIVNLAIENNIFSRKGAYYTYDEETYHGTNQVIKAFIKNPEIMEKIKEEIKVKLLKGR